MLTVLVTGSNSGFGYLTVIALAKRGHSVIATMREPDGKNRAAADKLRQVAQAEQRQIRVLELDVTSDKSVDAAFAAAGPVDAVINNAGYSIVGLAETATPAQMLAEFDTNVVGMHRVNRAALPHMRARRAGLLVHVSSGLGRIAASSSRCSACTRRPSGRSRRSPRPIATSSSRPAST
jgi:NAD(P)-dependent dehydrogenase (short-subunit alcohol dehydrogenase family)